MKLQISPLMIAIAILKMACGTKSPYRQQTRSTADEQLASEALFNFFAHLHAGEYNAETNLYGGSYAIMIEHNPDLDPDDQAMLWQTACRINGAQCLEVEEATWEADAQVPESVFLFSVVFRNEDGGTFSRGACCGEEDEERLEQREFAYSVMKADDCLFLVLNPPIYVP